VAGYDIRHGGVGTLLCQSVVRSVNVSGSPLQVWTQSVLESGQSMTLL
jgi:hypothetical protein